MPVPLSAIVSGEPGALLVMEAVPLALPVAEGANCAVKVVFCPAASVSGRDKPLMLKPVPEALAAERVTLAVPELVNVTVCDPLLPTRTFPKLTLAGLAVSCPCVPVPLRAIVRVGLDASLVSVMLPEAFPAAAGANCAVKVVLCPAARVSGVASPLALKPVPDELI